MKNSHLPNAIIWLTEHLSQYIMLQILLVFYLFSQKIAWKCIYMVLAAND